MRTTAPSWPTTSWPRLRCLRNICPGSCRPKELDAELRDIIAETGASSARRYGQSYGSGHQAACGSRRRPRHIGGSETSAGLTPARSIQQLLSDKMLTLQTIKADPEFVIGRLAVKGFDGRDIITRIIETDAERRRLQQKTDSDASRS